MITHNLTIALRNLLKYKTQTLVSLLGLAIGLATSSLSGMWLKYNLTYDTHWPESERTYYIQSKKSYDTQFQDYCAAPLAGYIKEVLPEAEETCRPTQVGIIRHNDTPIYINGVDSLTLRMFPIYILQGTPDFHLQPKQYALSESTAIKLYGTTNVIGLPLKNKDEVLGTVTTLFRDVEGHSNFTWDILTANIPVEARSFTTSSGETVTVSPWNQRTGSTIVRFHPDTDIEKAMNKLEAALKKDHQEETAFRGILLKDFKNREGQFHTVQLEHIRIFCLLGGLIVLAAMLNYLILFAIRIRMRVREMTLRKVHGASKASLTALLMTELLVLLVCTYPVGMLILELTLPAFRKLSGIEESLGYFYGEGTMFMLTVIAASLLLSWAIIYTQCRKTLQAGLRKDNLQVMRKVCLGIQLVISIGFIFCSTVMYKQLYYLHHSADTGFKNTEIGFVHNNLAGATPDTYMEIYQHMKQIPYIDAHALYGLPFNEFGQVPINEWSGKSADASPIRLDRAYINPDIYEHFGLQLLAGTVAKTPGEIVLNESALKVLGWPLEEAVGKTILTQKNYVVGVIKDIRLSPMEPSAPSLFYVPLEYENIRSIVFTYQGDFEEVNRKLTDYFKEKCPHIRIFGATTPAQWIKKTLVSEEALLKLLVVAATVSVFISLFGIFSLVNLSCERRRKEMALRKIHGAKVKDIAGLFAKEYAIVLALSALVAFLIGYAIMKEWMQVYVIQTDIPVWLYIGILLLTGLLITICVGYRIWKAANENPAEVVKSE